MASERRTEAITIEKILKRMGIPIEDLYFQGECPPNIASWYKPAMAKLRPEFTILLGYIDNIPIILIVECKVKEKDIGLAEKDLNEYASKIKDHAHIYVLGVAGNKFKLGYFIKGTNNVQSFTFQGVPNKNQLLDEIKTNIIRQQILTLEKERDIKIQQIKEEYSIKINKVEEY